MNSPAIQISGQGADAKRRRASLPQAAPHQFLFCSPSQWLIAAMSGLLVSGLAWPLYSHVSGWIGVVLFLMTVTVAHLVFTGDVLVPFPHIAILITGLQYVLAAWLSFYYPSDNPVYNIGERLPQYLAYAGGVVAAVCLGWAVSFWRLPRRTFQVTPISSSLLTELDILFWFGLASTAAGHFVNLGGLNFVLVLCANLRYLGALGRMLVNGPGWRWRVGMTLVLETLLAVHGGMFHGLLMWSAATFALYIYKSHPGKLVVLGGIVVGILLLPPLEQAKFYIRGKEWNSDEPEAALLSAATIENAGGWLKELGSGLVKSAHGDWDPDFMGYITVRFNQGWIINRVMETVPASQPYAKGKTLFADLEAVVLPRILFPNKYVANGKGNMARYANYQLDESTAMDLGYAGEMYANFGYWGGIAGCFGYALLLGLALRWVCRRAALNPLWWAFVPFVGLVALKAEGGIGAVWNWLAKATLVSVAIYFAFPAIRAALSRGHEPTEMPARLSRRERTRRLREEVAKAHLQARTTGTGNSV